MSMSNVRKFVTSLPILQTILILFAITFSAQAERNFSSEKQETLEHLFEELEKSVNPHRYLDELPAPTLVRRRRQANWLAACPAKPASGSNGAQAANAFMVFYSPLLRTDVRVTPNSEGNWDRSLVDELLDNGFNKSQPTLIYMHAFTQSSQSNWLRNVRTRYNEMFYRSESYQQEPSFNLLFFDWSGYSLQLYRGSASWVPSLGESVGKFLSELAKSMGYNMNQVHIISYSLSTHISGLAGRHVKRSVGQEIGQITALDPTGVCFHQNTAFAQNYALRATDANLVVARHYDMGQLGAQRAIGGVDIFVNGGRNQPSTSRSLGVSHHKASEHEAQRINEDFRGQCQEVAYACRSFKAFMAGECGDCGPNGRNCYYISTFGQERFARRGVPVNRRSTNYKPRTRMYIRTGLNKFCLHHYQVLVRMSPNVTPKSLKLITSGRVRILFGSSYEQQAIPVHQVKNSLKFTDLLVLQERLSDIDGGAIVQIDSSLSASDFKEFLNSLGSVELNYMSHALPIGRAKGSAKYCLKSATTNKLTNC